MVLACQMYEEMSIISCDGRLGVHSGKFKGRVQSSIIVESVMIDINFSTNRGASNSIIVMKHKISSCVLENFKVGHSNTC